MKLFSDDESLWALCVRRNQGVQWFLSNLRQDDILYTALHQNETPEEKF